VVLVPGEREIETVENAVGDELVISSA